MHGDILILGYGRPVRIAQRHRPADLPTDIGFVACDVLNRDSVLAAAQGAAQIVLAIGLPYSAKNWRSDWPLAMSNVLAAAQAHKACSSLSIISICMDRKP